MAKFDIDLTKVNDVVNPDRNKLPVQGNEHRMVKVAFDVFRLKGDETDDLWQVQADDDGEFLVRTSKYLDSINDEEKAKLAKEWSVSIDKTGENLTIAYSNDPIKRIASDQYGAYTYNDVIVLKQTLLKKLANDNFISKLISSLSKEKQDYFKGKYSKFANLGNRVEWWKSGPLSGKFKTMVDKASNLAQIEMIKRRFLDAKKGDLYNTFVNELYSITEPQEYLEAKVLKLKNTPKRRVEMGGEADIKFHDERKDPKLDPIAGIPTDQEHAKLMRDFDRKASYNPDWKSGPMGKNFVAKVDSAKNMNELKKVYRAYLGTYSNFRSQFLNEVKSIIEPKEYIKAKMLQMKNAPKRKVEMGGEADIKFHDGRKAPHVDPIKGIPTDQEHAKLMRDIDRQTADDDEVKKASVKLPGDVAGLTVIEPTDATDEKDVQNIKVVYEKKGRNYIASWEGQALIPSGEGPSKQNALKDLFRKLSKM
jgi:hypothetical protein